MKVLLINGSPNTDGNTARCLKEMETVFQAEGIDTEVIHVGHKDIRGCIGCRKCFQAGKCVFDDLVNDTAPKFVACDGIVVGSPVYYANANATLMAFLQRLFYSTFYCDKAMKVGAALAVARRGGITTTYDELNKFFAISGMPIASGQYWNGAHGAAPGQVEEDAEGLQQMRTLARNMSFLMKSIAIGKETYGLPKKEKGIFTNFIR